MDESIGESARGHIYVIAGALLLEADSLEDPTCAEMRQKVEAILNGREKPFRWKDEGVEKKGAMIGLIESEACAIAAISEPGMRFHQRQMRAECLRSICVTLAEEGATSLVIESRREQDSDDTDTVQAAKKQELLPSSFPEPTFAGKEEPLLWLPDAIAGAIREGETQTNGSWTERLTKSQAMIGLQRVQTRSDPGSRNHP